MVVGKVNACSICTNYTETLRTIVSTHDFKVVYTGADFLLVFGMALEKSGEVNSVLIRYTVIWSVTV